MDNGSNLVITSTGGAISVPEIQGDSDEDVTLNANGALGLAVIGDGTGINDVSLAGATINLSGNVQTSDDGSDNGLINVNGTAVVTSNITLNSSGGGGNITFTSTLDDDASGSSNRTLTLNAGTGGDIAMQGVVGGGVPLSSLVISNAKDVTFYHHA